MFISWCSLPHRASHASIQATIESAIKKLIERFFASFTLKSVFKALSTPHILGGFVRHRPVKTRAAAIMKNKRTGLLKNSPRVLFLRIKTPFHFPFSMNLQFKMSQHTHTQCIHLISCVPSAVWIGANKWKGEKYTVSCARTMGAIGREN